MRLLPSIALLALAACSDDPIPTSLLIVEEEVALGQVLCGTSRSGAVTVVNTGEDSADVAIASTLPDVMVSPVFTTIAPGEHRTFEVTVAMPEHGTPGFMSRGDLRVTSDELELRVPLAYETAGVSATLTTSKIVDFGELRPSSYATGYASLLVTSAGVEMPAVTAAIGFPSSPAFEVTTAQNGFIGIMLTGGPTVKRHEATLDVTITSENLCTPRQLSLELVGVVSNEPVLADRTVLDLGEIGACAVATANARLSNYGPSSDYTATLDDRSGWLELSGTPSGNVQGATITVATARDRPRPPAGPLEARATIAYATGSKTIPIRAVVLSHTATAPSGELDLGDVPAGATVTRKVTLRNTGNSVKSLELFGQNATVSPQSVQIEPTGTREVWVAYTAKNPPGTEIVGQVQIRFSPCGAMERIPVRGRIVK